MIFIVLIRIFHLVLFIWISFSQCLLCLLGLDACTLLLWKLLSNDIFDYSSLWGLHSWSSGILIFLSYVVLLEFFPSSLFSCSLFWDFILSSFMAVGFLHFVLALTDFTLSSFTLLVRPFKEFFHFAYQVFSVLPLLFVTFSFLFSYLLVFIGCPFHHLFEFIKDPKYFFSEFLFRNII